MKLGIVGTGMIVNICLDALQEIDNISTTSIWGRAQDFNQINQLSLKYKIENCFTDYSEFLKSDIDVVYLGIINNLHYQYALEALQAGKNVICEKPFTTTLKEAKHLQEIATASNLMIFEAITLIYSPNYHYIKENLNKIGDIKLVVANYSQYSSRYNQYMSGNVLPAFDPKMWGGALYDINVYNLHFIQGLFGKPKNVEYHANIGFNGIDTSGMVMLDFEHFKAVCVGAKDCNGINQVVIQGTNGYIKLNSAANVCLEVILFDGKQEVTNLNKNDNHMVNELIAFEDIYRNNDFTKCYQLLTHSVELMEVLEKARRSANLKFG